MKITTGKKTIKEMYDELLEARVREYVINEIDYRDLSNKDWEGITAYLVNEINNWDFGPLMEKAYANLPNTFSDGNFKRYGITLNSKRLFGSEYYITKDEYDMLIDTDLLVRKTETKIDRPELIHYKVNISYPLYQHYLLNFNYINDNNPKSLKEFKEECLKSKDYVESIDGISL